MGKETTEITDVMEITKTTEITKKIRAIKINIVITIAKILRKMVMNARSKNIRIGQVAKTQQNLPAPLCVPTYHLIVIAAAP